MEEPLILYPQRPRPNYSDQITAYFFNEGLQPNVIQEVLELQTALGLVASGIGFTIVPKSVQKMRAEDVVYRSLSNKKLTSPVVMSYRKETPAPVLANFLKRIHLLAELTRKKNKH